MKMPYRFFVDVEAGDKASLRLRKKIAKLIREDRELSAAKVTVDPLNPDTHISTAIFMIANELRRTLNIVSDKIFAGGALPFFASCLSALDKAADRMHEVNSVLFRIDHTHKLMEQLTMQGQPVEITPDNINKLPLEALQNLVHAVCTRKGVSIPADCRKMDRDTLLTWLKRQMFQEVGIN